MANIKLGDKTYQGVQVIRMDTTDGKTVDFAPYEETFAAGKAEGYTEGETAGRTAGYHEGKTEGIAAGIQTEHDRFWDACQKNGQRSNYAYAFSHDSWTDNNFFPKYDMKPTNAVNMFWNVYVTNLAQRLRECNVALDTSAATSMNTFAAGSAISHLPEISFVSAKNPSNAVGSCYNLVEIEKVIVKDDGSTTFTSWFGNCSKLTNITFEGVIGQDINFQWSPLSVESMKSVIAHLKNYSGTADASTKTVKFTDSCWAALEADSSAPDGNTWRDYVETTLGWLT